MADALMGWDKKQKRWRAMYKGVVLRIKASDLGGSNYEDTVVAANKWFREQCARIDREKGVVTYRQFEEDYREELDSMLSAIKSFSLTMRLDPKSQSRYTPVVELMNQKVTAIRTLLQKTAPLPPLSDLLRNPIYISPERLEKEATQEAVQIARSRLREKNIQWISDEEIEDTYDNDGMETLEQRSRWNMHAHNVVEHTIDNLIQDEAEAMAGLQNELVRHKKEELGLIKSEYDRGEFNQLLKEQGIEIAESRKLEHHIDKFIEVQRRKCAEKKISVGRLGKIETMIKNYKNWSLIMNGNVDRIGTKEHIDGYYIYLSDKVISKVFSPRYANDLFTDFKMLINWLYAEEVLKELPRCLQLKNKKYRFRVPDQTPETIPLEQVHQILDAVSNPRLKLCILLTLNCGFGASEIGQLPRDEYDPVTGRIMHKRCKTKDSSPNVPKVCFKLWDITKELLDKEIASQAPEHRQSKYLLVNSNGNPLWREFISDDKKTQRVSNITCEFKRLIAKIRESDPAFPAVQYYAFRRTGSTLISNEPRFRGLDWIWLGHSPKAVKDKHYNAQDPTILDECIAWLHCKIFDLSALPEGQNC